MLTFHTQICQKHTADTDRKRKNVESNKNTHGSNSLVACGPQKTPCDGLYQIL